ncbi:MAG: argininosuccinate lyase [bacterium]|nr:argininosuccinate lyase [bacterium]
MSQDQGKPQVWGGRLAESPAQANVRFCAGRDVSALPMADQDLVFWDIWTNLAHAKMLSEVGVLNNEEYRQIYNALKSLDPDQFVLDPGKEDVHINLEHYLTYQCGIEAGKKIHSGRSRNDQVATDMRLYLRDRLLHFTGHLSELALAVIERAEGLKEAVMPGFTHYQPGMPTTAAHWLTAWSQALLRDLNALMDNFKGMNRCPLGSAASFGTSWPIDRERTAELLAFDGVEENSLDAISSRGEQEARVAASIAVAMNHLSQISQDLILWSTPFYGFAKVADRFVTGSSIMPQKRNPDFAEIIRAKAAQTTGSLTSLLGIAKGAMSGYNRDSQQTKYLIMDLFREVMDAPLILAGVVESLTFDEAAMRAACNKDFLNAADVADFLAQRFSLSFRDCYEVLSLAVKYSSEESGQLTLGGLQRAVTERGLADQVVLDASEVARLNDAVQLLKEKTHTGAPSPEAVAQLIQRQREQLGQLQEQLGQLKMKLAVREVEALVALRP